jgi:hypothetical protein
MKKILFFSSIVILSGILYSLYASAQSNTDASPSSIHLQFQNNSWLPGKFTLKIKSAGSNKYGVISFRLFSFQKYKSEYSAGTSIYLIDEEEQQALMQGGDASGKLLIEVKAADQGKIIRLIT